MPLFKTWDVTRTKNKCLVANTLEELVSKGRKKLGIDDDTEILVFHETDGTEVDDDESLLEYGKGSVFILGQEWKAANATPTEETGGKDVAKDTSLFKPDYTTSIEITPDPEDASLEDTENFSDRDTSFSETAELDTSFQNISSEDESFEKSEVMQQFSNETCADDDEPITYEPENKKRRKSFSDVLMANKYMNAKMKNFKIYSEKEITSATSELEKSRRRFWNEKAEQLAKHPKTSTANKTTISGIIDVSWTLRKTSFIESDAGKVGQEENVLFRKEEASTIKVTSQKPGTIPKNMERMAAAHVAVENIDQEIKEYGERVEKAASKEERNVVMKAYNVKKRLLDGAYTELKRAQEATVKSIKAKRRQLEVLLKSKTAEDPEEPTTSASGS